MLYQPDVCNCTMPYVPRTVPAYAVRDPAYTAEVFALTLVEIDVILLFSLFNNFIGENVWQISCIKPEFCIGKLKLYVVQHCCAKKIVII